MCLQVRLYESSNLLLLTRVLFECKVVQSLNLTPHIELGCQEKEAKTRTHVGELEVMGKIFKNSELNIVIYATCNLV